MKLWPDRDAAQHAARWPSAKWLTFAGGRAPQLQEALSLRLSHHPRLRPRPVAQIQWHGTRVVAAQASGEPLR